MGDPARRASWGIVLAGGDGKRLRALTTTRAGAVPKQYCSLQGGPSLLRMALLRARAVAHPARVAVVVAATHRRWWARDLADLPAVNIVVQPANRGTAAGILLPLLGILARDAEALVAVLPSDHWFEREQVMRHAVRRAFHETRQRPSRIVLLGIRPEHGEPDLGWILPAGPPGETRLVASFHEKPGAEEARRLLAAGGLLSSFLFVARADALLRLFTRLLPEVTEPLSAWHQRPAEELASLYERLPARDFSRDLLQRVPESLSVLAAPACGWSDLGTPERVSRCVESARRRGCPPERRAPGMADTPLRLADRLTARPDPSPADVR